jgi:hypothetical protein
MKAASLSQLKKELSHIPPEEVLEMCMHLAKYKKENKELLTYLLFEVNDPASYIQGVKEGMDEQYREINQTNLYWAKKSLRKILRITNKHIKYSGSKQIELELLIYYCQKLKKSGIPFEKSTALSNLYIRQTQRIKKALAGLHEDLQFDYADEVKSVM